MLGFPRRNSINNGTASRLLAGLVVFGAIFLAFAVTIVILYDKPKESWPHILGYVITNPLILTIGAALLGFLTVERFREISGRVTEIGKQVYEISSSLEKNLRSSTEALSKDLSAEWGRVQTKLDAVKRENPWLESVSKLEITVNVPTTGAALRNIEQFLRSDDSHIAYEILYETATGVRNLSDDKQTRQVEGTPSEFETLALLAMALFSDIYLCDRLLGRAEETSGRFSTPWKARRLIFALLNGQQAVAENLASAMEWQLRPTFWRKLLSRFGRRAAILPEADFFESMCALRISDNFIRNEDAIRRESWVNEEGARLPDWAKQLATQTERLLRGENQDDEDFVRFAAATSVRTSTALVRAQQLMTDGRIGELRKYVQGLARHRPALSILERVPSVSPNEQKGPKVQAAPQTQSPHFPKPDFFDELFSFKRPDPSAMPPVVQADGPIDGTAQTVEKDNEPKSS